MTAIADISRRSPNFYADRLGVEITGVSVHDAEGSDR